MRTQMTIGAEEGDADRSATLPRAVSWGEATRTWARVASLSFGGPAGQIAVMHRVLVEEKRWFSEARFLHALNFCMLLPGPEAMQLATYCGWLLHGTRGGLVAGTLFVLPGFVTILALSATYALWQHTPLVAGLFLGLKPAVLAVVVEAVVRIGRRVLRNRAMLALAAAAFAAIFFGQVPFPAIIAAAGLIGLAGGRWRPEAFCVLKGHAATEGDDAPRVVYHPDATAHGALLGRSLRALAVWVTIWWGPIGLLAVWLGSQHLLVELGLFFSQTAVVTFGGAYSVLAYVAQHAVEDRGWLSAAEMLDGLGMAETTPGPLIMVLEYVGFLAAFRQPAPFGPLAAATLAAVVATWATFAPCFLWIFLGAPWIERLRKSRALGAALSAITAAVVGVVLNLAVWFALHTLFAEVHEWTGGGLRSLWPVGSSLRLPELLIALAAFAALFRWKLGMLWTLAGAAVAGLAVTALRGA